MTDLFNKLPLKELAEENIYFAKRERELITAMHEKRLAEIVGRSSEEHKGQARTYETKFEELAHIHMDTPRKLARAYKDLLDEVLEWC